MTGPSMASSPILAKIIPHNQEQESVLSQEIKTWETSIQKIGTEKTKLFKRLECLLYILNITDNPESVKTAQEKCALYKRVSEHIEKRIK